MILKYLVETETSDTRPVENTSNAGRSKLTVDGQHVF
jgi:hypothetical protein